MSASHRLSSLAVGGGVLALVLGFCAETRGYFGPFGNMHVVAQGVLVLIAPGLAFLLATVLLLLRRGATYRGTLAFGGAWSLAGLVAGLTLGRADDGYCRPVVDRFTEVARGIPSTELVVVAGGVVAAMLWLTVGRLGRLDRQRVTRAAAVGATFATSVVAVMTTLGVVGAETGACAVPTSVAVAAAFASAFLALGVVLLPALVLMRASAVDSTRPWLAVPLFGLLLHLVNLSAGAAISQMRLPVELVGQATVALESRTSARAQTTSAVLCMRSHEGHVRIEGPGILVDLYDDGSVSTLHVSVGAAGKIWIGDRGAVMPVASERWERGTVTSDGLAQLDPEPGDEQAGWQAEVSWDCTGAQP